MKNNMKKKASLFLNGLIIIVEVFALIVSFQVDKMVHIEYYTMDSNLLALLSSIIYVIYLLRNEKLSKFAKILKYISTVCLTITFIVVLVILLPMVNFNFNLILFDGTMFYHHVLCPVLAIITFIFYDDLGKYNDKDVEYPMMVTLVYAFILIMLNLANIVDGPYPFLRVYENTIVGNIIWLVLILLIAYLISKIVLNFRIKYYKSR